MRKIVRRFAGIVLAIALCAAVSACGTEPQTAVSDTPEESALVLGVSGEESGWLKDAVEANNADNSRRKIEMVEFEHVEQLLRAVDDGTQVDMYFISMSQSYIEDTVRELWERSVDLLPRLECELAPNLAEALTHSGELRYLPYDFTIDAMQGYFDEMPENMAEAQTLADASGESLFYRGWGRSDLFGHWLYPYLCAADEAAREDILGAISAQDENTREGSMYRPVTFTSDVDFGCLSVLEYRLEAGEGGYVIGVPGSGTAGVYMPMRVFGIMSGCTDVDSAWEFLSQSYSAEAQSSTRYFPAELTALNARIDELAEKGTTHEHAVAVFRDVLERTTAAVGVNMLQMEQTWYTDTFNKYAAQSAQGG